MDAISVRDLRLTYPRAERPAVGGLSFSVRRAEVFGLLGPSGAGKSTTVKVLLGLLRGFTGEAVVLGVDVRRRRPDDYARIGVAFELPAHFARLTAREELGFFAALYPGRHLDVDALLASLGLADAADARTGTYSRGMLTRLTLARALLHEPELLLLDEPTSGLDPGTARRVRGLIAAQRAAGRTVLLTTHDMVTAAELCDRVGFVVDGRLALVDTPAGLAQRGARRVVRVGCRDGAGRATREFPLDGLADDAAFRALLRSGTVETIHTAEATLEDVFVAVTGRALS